MLRPSSILALSLLGPAASAQIDVTVQIVPAVEAKGADVRETVRQLFQWAGMSYTINADVQGTLDLRLRNVPWEVALQTVLRQVDATYRVEGGVFQIVRRENGPEARPTAFFAIQPDLDRAYVRLGDLASQPRKLAAWVDPRFVLFSADGKMRKGAEALEELAAVERRYPGRTAEVKDVEPPLPRRAPGVDEYATVYVSYDNPRDHSPGPVAVDTWRRPVGGSWRLVARRLR